MYERDFGEVLAAIVKLPAGSWEDAHVSGKVFVHVPSLASWAPVLRVIIIFSGWGMGASCLF